MCMCVVGERLRMERIEIWPCNMIMSAEQVC